MTNAADLNPAVCVVLLAYARPKLLANALESVAAQTIAPARVLVVDDASPTPLAELVEIPPGLNCEFIRQPVNGGPAAAAARGLRAADCGLVAFLNDDDAWEPSLLEKLCFAIGNDRSVGVAFCDHHVMNDAGERDPLLSDECSSQFSRAGRRPGIVADLPRAALVEQSVGAQSFALWRREALDPAIIEAGGAIWDYYVSLSACMSGCHGYYLPERLGSYRLSPSGITNRQRPSAQISVRARTIAADVLIMRSDSLAVLHPFARRQCLRVVVSAFRTALGGRRANLLGQLFTELSSAILAPERPSRRW